MLDMDEKLMNRSVNEGFSGGEKKRNEILQMAVLEPRLPILDETDSGLGIDALRIVAQGVDAMRNPERAIIMVNCASVRATSVLPTSVGPRKRNEPMGRFGFFRPHASGGWRGPGS